MSVAVLFLIFSESVGWVPMWDEYPDEDVGEFMEAYGLVVEDLEVMNGAFRQDNQNCEIFIFSFVLVKRLTPNKAIFLMHVQGNLFQSKL